MGRSVVVMSGGGAKGSFELGVVDYLIREHQIDPVGFVGVSTGNLNAAILAQGQGKFGLVGQLDELTNLWFGIANRKDICKLRFMGVLAFIFKSDSIYDNKALFKKIKDNIQPDKLKSSGRELRIGVVGLKSGKYEVIDGTHPDIHDMILASTAIPIAFCPVKNGGELYVDGGVRDITPLRAAFKVLQDTALGTEPSDDHDTIYVILASPLDAGLIEDDKELNGGIKIGARTLLLLTNEIFRDDLKRAVSINNSIAYYEDLCKKYDDLPDGFPYADRKQVKLVKIQPEILHMDSLEFDHDKIMSAFKAGRGRAKITIDLAKENGGSWIPEELSGN